MAGNNHEDHADSGGSLLAEVSNEMVGIYKTMFGRGPTRARSTWAGPDVLVCTLENSLTVVEQSMVELGEGQRLRDIRMFFQYATRDRFVESVERLTDRAVYAFVSGIDVDVDVSTELFY